MREKHWILLISLTLTFMGIIMVLSSTGIDGFSYFKKEVLWFVVGILVLVVGSRIDMKVVKQYAPWIFILTIVLVCLTYTPLGRKIGGARRWIRLGVFNFQPSELMKLGVVCLYAWILSNRIIDVRKLKGFLKALFILVLSILPILGQPDFGTSFVILMVGMMMIYIAGAPLKYVMNLLIGMLPLLFYLIISAPYRLRRVAAFLNPWEDPQGKGFQIVQSFLAIGRGQVTGVGLGESTQKLHYLPAAHTDFIFSIIAEELGFIGGCFVILCFVFLTLNAFKLALKTDDLFEQCFIIGGVSFISIQGLFNIAVVTGSVPTKGITLPFISFGGSSLSFNLLLIGLILGAAEKIEHKVFNEKVKDKFKTKKQSILKYKYSKPVYV